MGKKRHRLHTPIDIRHDDTTLEMIKKLIRQELALKEGKLPDRRFTLGGGSGIANGDWLGPEQINTIGKNIGFDRVTEVTPTAGLASGAMAALRQGMHFVTPSNDSYYVNPPGGRTVEMAGTSYYVDSNNESFNFLPTLVFGDTTESGYASVLIQGLDLGSDGDRAYYIIDSDYLKLYFEYDSGAGTSKLHFNPDARNNNKLVTLDVPTSGLGAGWFGYGVHEIIIEWDFFNQVFELWYDTYRGTLSVNTGDASKPEFSSLDRFVITNSSKYVDSPGASAGEENMYNMIDEIRFAGDFPPLRVITAKDGGVSKTLYPIHHGITSTACDVTSATPIDLGSAAEPFDALYVKDLTAYCSANIPGVLKSMSPVVCAVHVPTTITLPLLIADSDPIDHIMFAYGQALSGGPVELLVNSQVPSYNNVTYYLDDDGTNFIIVVYNNTSINWRVKIWYL